MGGLTTGLVQVYTGTGKGKTTAALGQAWRALGAGLRVCVVQFLKGGLIPSEQSLAAGLAPGLEIHSFGHPATAALYRGEPSEEDRRLVAAAWDLACRALQDPGWDLVVLDEINNVLHLGLLPVQELLAALGSRPATMEVICTGREAPPQLCEFADLVTEMREVKHPFAAGLPARRGIEI